ncbi:Peptidoglycan-recognition protein LF [Lucilia cuprina]|nr:Peptidoglycan-recognition protein LF [Lucilia cuprina]
MEICEKCRDIFETHEQLLSVECSGPCLGKFHQKCTNLNKNEITCVKLSTNIKWLCDYCSMSASVCNEKNYRTENISGKVIKQLELQENILIDIQNRLKIIENERNLRNVSIDLKAKDINSSAEQSGKLYGYISKHKKIIIPCVLAFMTMLIVAIILGSRALSDSKNTNGHHVNDDEECSGNGTFCLIERDVWRAHPQKNIMEKQKLPLHRAIISHTASEPCETLKICAERIRVIQEFHMNSLNWDDIGYNFLISSDGRVYVGRGWDAVGAHTKGYNYDSVGITFIGTYMKTPPTEEQLNACLLLLEEGLRLKKLDPNYHVYGARQFSATESPGNMLYNKIKKWERWSADINQDSTKTSLTR